MRVEAHGEKCCESGPRRYCPLGYDARGNCGSFSAVELEPDEDAYQQDETEDTAPDFRILPWVRRAAPLQGEKKTDDGADKEKGSGKVHLVDLLPERQGTVFPSRVLEEDEDSEDCDAANRQIDPKTPSPRNAVGKHSTEDGSNDG